MGVFKSVALGAFYRALFASLIAGLLAASPAHAERRVALVIGNGAYAHAPPLPNPVHDAEDVAAALKRSGFEVISGSDLAQADMQENEIRFARAAIPIPIASMLSSRRPAAPANGSNCAAAT